jgi:hypothetical protein
MKIAKLFFIVSVSFICSMLSCSHANKDYERLQKFQSDKEQLLQQNYNYQMKVQACDEVLDSLHVFQTKNPKSSYDVAITKAILSWEAHKLSLDQDKDYENVMKTQQTSEQSQSYSNDFDIKIRCCNDAISAIGGFLDRYNQDEAKPLLATALVSWKDKKNALEQEINSLLQKAYDMNENNVTQAAQLYHSMSNISSISLKDRQKDKQGDNILINDTYAVRMVGRILGTNVFNFKVKSTAKISMANKTVDVNNAQVIE